jgi:hypothetical protein
MDTFDRVMEALEDMNNADLFDVWRDYCEANNSCGDMVYSMDFFDEDFYGMNPSDVARLVKDEDFDIDDAYYKHTIYGVESYDEVGDAIDFDGLCNYLVKHDEDFSNDDIREALDGDEEDEDDEDYDEEDEDDTEQEDSGNNWMELEARKAEIARLVG